MHVSKVGKIAETPITALLESCNKFLVTGTVHVQAQGFEGQLKLRAGAVEEVTFAGLSDRQAMAKLRALMTGTYQLTQRLPDLSRELSSSVSFVGSLSDVSVIDLMRHCEANALTCVIEITSKANQGEIRYRVGEIQGVSYNGDQDDERIGDILAMEGARFAVRSVPLDVSVEGWPIARRVARGSSGIEALYQKDVSAEQALPVQKDAQNHKAALRSIPKFELVEPSAFVLGSARLCALLAWAAAGYFTYLATM